LNKIKWLFCPQLFDCCLTGYPRLRLWRALKAEAQQQCNVTKIKHFKEFYL
jgi:hypothetical protein